MRLKLAWVLHSLQSVFPINSKKGFYIVSPMLGIFFFLIATSIAAYFVTEDLQQVETAKAGTGSNLVFAAFAIQTDAQEVFFQNYMQRILDSYRVGEDSAIITELEAKIREALQDTLIRIYGQLYSDRFSIDCETVEGVDSLVYVNFNNQRGGVKVLEYQGQLWDGTFSPEARTAIWPVPSRYSLHCVSNEPPVDVQIEFTSRWYQLDSKCICCQIPDACNTVPSGLRTAYEDCLDCLLEGSP